MFELLDNALKALAGYPPLAAFAGLIVIGGGVWLMVRGERDRKSSGNGQTLPAWTLYGPAHDAIGAIHDIAEQSRQQTDLLKRIENLSTETLRELHNNTAILEAVRNESRLR